jgi:hypothetical protein
MTDANVPKDAEIPAVPLGTVIARRELCTVADAPVHVLVGAPVHVGDGWDWACPYRIEGLGEPVEGRTFGIDALQALQLVSSAIRGDLERSGERLTWLDSEYWQSGFPRPLESFGVQELETDVLRYVDDATARWLAERGGRTDADPTGGDEG